MEVQTKTISLRMPLNLLKKMVEDARKARRSLSAEIIVRLEGGTK